jgi:RimJ/RimL family protein N-acetyltransferase
MNLIFGGVSAPGINRVLGDWAAAHIWHDASKFAEPYGTMGVQDDSGRLLGVVVFHNWDYDHGVIEISAASESPRWLTRTVLREIFQVCFDQKGCQLVCARMAPDAVNVRDIFRRYGFEEQRLPRLRGRNKDEILCTLTDDKWRDSKWARKNHGQESTKAA